MKFIIKHTLGLFTFILVVPLFYYSITSMVSYYSQTEVEKFKTACDSNDGFIMLDSYGTPHCVVNK